MVSRITDNQPAPTVDGQGTDRGKLTRFTAFLAKRPSNVTEDRTKVDRVSQKLCNDHGVLGTNDDGSDLRVRCVCKQRSEGLAFWIIDLDPVLVISNGDQPAVFHHSNSIGSYDWRMSSDNGTGRRWSVEFDTFLVDPADDGRGALAKEDLVFLGDTQTRDELEGVGFCFEAAKEMTIGVVQAQHRAQFVSDHDVAFEVDGDGPRVLQVIFLRSRRSKRSDEPAVLVKDLDPVVLCVADEDVVFFIDGEISWEFELSIARSQCSKHENWLEVLGQRHGLRDRTLSGFGFGFGFGFGRGR